MQRSLGTLLCAGLLAAFPLAAPAADHDHDHEHEQLGAHVHGEAELLIAQDGKVLEMEFSSPAMNIVGFEHAPSTEEHQRAIHDAMDTLRDGESLFLFTPAAGCRMAEVAIEPPHHPNVIEDEHEHEHEGEHEGEHEHEGDHAHDGKTRDHRAEDEHHDHDDEHGHSEFQAHYRFECADPAKLKGMDVRLLKVFPGTHKLHVQSISASGQHAAELDAGHHELQL